MKIRFAMLCSSGNSTLILRSSKSDSDRKDPGVVRRQPLLG